LVKKIASLAPYEKMSKNISNFERVMMAHLKALCILKWNLGSYMNIYEVPSSMQFLTDVSKKQGFLRCNIFSLDIHRKLSKIFSHLEVLKLK